MENNNWKVKETKRWTNATKKPVRRSDGVVYTSTKKAAKEMIKEGRTNTSIDSARKTIKNCLNGKIPTAYGFSWVYA